MSITPQDRPTFKVAFQYRCHSLISRETFLAFQKSFEEIVNTIVNSPDEAALWKYVRSLFDFDDYADTVPINSANLSIVFNAVQHCMNAMALDWNRDISIQKRIKPFVLTIQTARALIASQLNVAPELVAFMRNGSDPNAVINNGMDFATGDEVLVWDENHPTLDGVAWNIRKLRFPKINIVPVPLDGETEEDKIIEKFVSKVNEHTKLVALSEISYLTGTRLPVKKLIQKIHGAKKGKVHVHLDGAQAWGALKHDLKDIDCDSYSAGSHKWFLGPKETGILYMKRECVPNFWPKDIGYNGEMQSPPDLREPGSELPKDASRFEMVGQRNDTNLIGLLYTADLLDLIGFERIEGRIKALTTRLRQGLTKVAAEFDNLFIIETPSEMILYHGILIIKFKDETKGKGHKGKKRKAKDEAEPEKPVNEQLYDRLYENHNIGVSSKMGNRVRFSPHIYNTEDHIDRAIQAVRFELGQILGSK